MIRFPFLFSSVAWLAGPLAAASLSVADYPSIQAALDANPGKVLQVPSGTYEIDRKIVLNKDGGGLEGSGHIIQTRPEQPILELENAARLSVRGLTLCRPEGATETPAEGILASRCRSLVIADVTVQDNRTDSAAITVRESQGVQIRHCTVENYQRITVDNRMASENYGFAFRCINGTGMAVTYSQDVLIEGNRVIESNLRPTPEMQKKHGLGKFTEKQPQKGRIVNQQTWDEEYMQAWHQGSAIIVSGPKDSRYIRILGNHIRNAAQGIDIHADHVTVAGNIIENAFMGMKAMHGSRHLLINGNQFIRNAIWSIGLMPGAASLPATADTPDNSDGGSVISNNLISEFGQGDSAWIWGDERAPLRFDNGQLPANPPLKDVLITGNIIYDSSLLAPQAQERRTLYRYAVQIAADVRGLHFHGNLFHPGRDGLSNRPLEP